MFFEDLRMEPKATVQFPCDITNSIDDDDMHGHNSQSIRMNIVSIDFKL